MASADKTVSVARRTWLESDATKAIVTITDVARLAKWRISNVGTVTVYIRDNCVAADTIATSVTGSVDGTTPLPVGCSTMLLGGCVVFGHVSASGGALALEPE